MLHSSGVEIRLRRFMLASLASSTLRVSQYRFAAQLTPISLIAFGDQVRFADQSSLRSLTAFGGMTKY